MSKAQIFLLLLTFILTLAILAIISGLTFISHNTNKPLLYFPQTIAAVFKEPTITSDFDFLLLGLDPRDDPLEKTTTTDTIIIGRFNRSSTVNLVSIPRDLWIYSQSSKINQIYSKSLETGDKFKYIQESFSDITGLNLSRTIIITTKNLEQLTALVGGVDVYLSQGFVDDQYPNPEYIKNPSPNIPIYTTVEFPSGWIHLDSDNIAPFVRSRKSITGGTDLGRIARQQLLINALINKIRSPQFLLSSTRLFTLYRFLRSEVTTNFSDHDLISIIKANYSKFGSLKINTFSIPSSEDDNGQVIYHPKSFINNQWVFIPKDKDYSSFKKFIFISLHES